MVQSYKRPPIVEAVLEVRFETPIDSGVLDRVKDELLKEYPAPPLRTMAVNVELSDAPKVLQQAQGYRLSSGDGAAVVTVGPNLVSTSRLAPYEGWEGFIATARRNFSTWRKLTGSRKIARLGVRYVNRIDVPGENVQIGDYLTVGLIMPPLGVPPLSSFAINAAMPLGKDNCTLILNSGSTPSPLVNVNSLILDLDVSREVDLPQKEDNLWELADRIREYKNAVFEGCITDRARELFDK
jgi:uncharacterized protein (TIGR04255 family)